MSEIEKAREALVEKLMVEGGGTREEAEDVVSYFAPFIEASARAIAREEIEAAKGYKPQPGDRAFDVPSVTPAPKVAFQVPTGDPDLDKHILEYNIWFNLCLTPEQKAEHLRKQRESWVRGEMGLGLDNKRATEKGGEANSPGRHERSATGLDKSPPAVEAPAAGEDTTALARRLAEELSKIAGHVVVSETAIEALAEARKRGLIE